MSEEAASQDRRAREELLGRLRREERLRIVRALHQTRGHLDDEGDWIGGLYAFIQYFWPVLEPETPLVLGWPLIALCEHLEAVTFGETKRLLINIFPGAMKSLIVNVFWPAWEWGPQDLAHLRYVAFSYSATLTERDNLRFGDLVCSEMYKELYGHRVDVVQRGAVRVSNKRKGWKFASSIGGVGTGERGNRVLFDDPHNVKESESEPVRTETVRWFREAMSNRLNDPDADAIVIIMQRVHENDVSGEILDLGLDYTHLCVRMEYDPSYQLNDDGTVRSNSIGWVDPRFDENDIDGSTGILAWPERFSPETCMRLKAEMGPYAWASQFQQAPAPRGGGLFKNEWWQLWESPNGRFPEFEYMLASLDSAFTEDEANDPSGFTIWGVWRNENNYRRLMLVHAWRKHLEFSGSMVPQKPGEHPEVYRRRAQPHWGLIDWVADSCRRFKVHKLIIEAKANGLSAAQELRKRHGREGWGIDTVPVRGDKYSRAQAVQATFAQLQVYAPSRDWAQMVIEEMAVFPKGRYKDLTDSVTQAISYLRSIGMAQSDEEQMAEEAERVTHRPRQRPVYQI